MRVLLHLLLTASAVPLSVSGFVRPSSIHHRYRSATVRSSSRLHAEDAPFYDLVDRDMDGNEVKMDNFKGDVICVVNVASKCGLTKSNYVQFSKLYDEYSSKGLKLLAFPCNQFGGQEPGTHEEILEFVETNFGVGTNDKFTWFEKADVNGDDAREVYSFLKQKLPSDDQSSDVDIAWNFAKFLVDREGTPFKRYHPKTNPEDMVADIEELLA